MKLCQKVLKQCSFFHAPKPACSDIFQKSGNQVPCLASMVQLKWRALEYHRPPQHGARHRWLGLWWSGMAARRRFNCMKQILRAARFARVCSKFCRSVKAKLLQVCVCACLNWTGSHRLQGGVDNGRILQPYALQACPAFWQHASWFNSHLVKIRKMEI